MEISRITKPAQASFPVVVLKSKISQNFDVIIREIEKWAKIFG